MHGSDDGDEGERSSSATSLHTSAIGRVVEALSTAAGAIASLLVIVMLALIAYAVGQRYILGVPLTWADDLSSYLLVAFVSFGAAEALRRGDHIAIDLLAARSGTTGRQLLAAWSSLAVLVFAGVLAWSAYGQAKFAYEFGSYTIDQLELQAWIPLLPLVGGAALLAIVACARLVTAIRAAVPSNREPRQ